SILQWNYFILLDKLFYNFLCFGQRNYAASRGRENQPPVKEQQKIASIFSSTDKEIETHQKQLAALKQQKKGLMQQLLTGKKRVKIDEPASRNWKPSNPGNTSSNTNTAAFRRNRLTMAGTGMTGG
ncbi:MAG: hypothetical protein ACRESZ_02260, partial [Methylococcales bacterium]